MQLVALDALHDQGLTAAEIAQRIGRTRKGVTQMLANRRRDAAGWATQIAAHAPVFAAPLMRLRIEYPPASVQWARRVAQTCLGVIRANTPDVGMVEAVRRAGITPGEVDEAVYILRSHKGRK